MKSLLAILFLMMLSIASLSAEGSEGVLFENSYLPELLNGVLMVLGLAGTWALKRIATFLKKKGLDDDAIDALAAGVAEVYHETARELKAKASDRKLSNQEAAELRRLALEKAKNFATGPVKNHIVKLGKGWAESKIEDIISARKRK